jgi:malate dehydrogenase (oxaloacetate-decarboxylating)
MPQEALVGGAAVVASGRSDFGNQVNNVLVFPGIFRGIFDAGAREITEAMLLAAAHRLAGLIAEPVAEKILPGVFEPGVAETVAAAIRAEAAKTA